VRLGPGVDGVNVGVGVEEEGEHFCAQQTKVRMTMTVPALIATPSVLTHTESGSSEPRRVSVTLLPTRWAQLNSSQANPQSRAASYYVHPQHSVFFGRSSSSRFSMSRKSKRPRLRRWWCNLLPIVAHLLCTTTCLKHKHLRTPYRDFSIRKRLDTLNRFGVITKGLVRPFSSFVVNLRL
jgi:hypothetical protein